MELTPEERQRIYLEEKARLEAQSQIKAETSQKTGSGIGIGLAVIIGVGVLLWIIGSSSNSSETSTSNSPPPSPNDRMRTVDQARARFYSDAVSYLGVIGDEGARVSQTMAGDGSTLAGIEAVLRSAKSTENSSYDNYSSSRASGGIPNGLGDIAENADEVHRRLDRKSV